MSFIRMKVTRADQKMTQTAARNCSHSWCADPVYIRPLTPKGTQVPLAVRYCACVVAMTCPEAVRCPQPYSIMLGSPKMPSSSPPVRPAMPWV